MAAVDEKLRRAFLSTDAALRPFFQSQRPLDRNDLAGIILDAQGPLDAVRSVIDESCKRPAPAKVPKEPSAPAPPIYYATVLEIERQRLARGIAMEQMSELMGTAERSYPKMLYPETLSGRMARWDTVQLAVDTLYPDGFDLRIKAMVCRVLSMSGTRHKIQAEAAHWDGKRTSEIMAERGRKGNAAFQALSPQKRASMARKGGEARWAGVAAGDRSAITRRAALTLSPEQRKANARKAAQIRWAKVRGEQTAGGAS